MHSVTRLIARCWRLMTTKKWKRQRVSSCLAVPSIAQVDFINMHFAPCTLHVLQSPWKMANPWDSARIKNTDFEPPVHSSVKAAVTASISSLWRPLWTHCQPLLGCSNPYNSRPCVLRRPALFLTPLIVRTTIWCFKRGHFVSHWGSASLNPSFQAKELAMLKTECTRQEAS